MKIIILNRKRLGVTLIIIGLMFVLIGAEKKFEQRLRMTALMQTGIDSLKQYEVLQGKYKYKLPDRWKTTERSFSGGEIIYHNEFTSNDGIINGNVQVWNLREDLKTFLDSSKESSYKPQNSKDYKLTPIKINKNSGYVLNYTVTDSNGKNYKAYEYFIDDKDKFFRFSFYVMEENFKENMPTIFEAIVNTYENGK